MVLALEGRDDTVMRALTSYHYGLGSIPAIYDLHGLSLLLVLIPVPRVFSPGSWFSSLLKNQHYQIPNSTLEGHPN